MSESEAKAKTSEESKKPFTNKQLTSIVYKQMRQIDVLEELYTKDMIKLELDIEELKKKISAMELIQEMYAINITPTRVENDTEQALNL
jgi:hypothetical protein